MRCKSCSADSLDKLDDEDEDEIREKIPNLDNPDVMTRENSASFTRDHSRG